MKKIYICSPLQNKIGNIKTAEHYARKIAMMGDIPICPHQIARYLDDDNSQERKIGMNIGLELLKISDEIYVYDNNGISIGMESEIKLANELGKKVVYQSLLKYN